MKLPPRDKIAFFLSAMVLAWFYGFATSARQWFPNDLMVRAWNQAEAVVGLGTPGFVMPRVYEREGARTLDEASVASGLTLVPSVWADFDWKPGLKLIDRDGRVLHGWNTSPARIFPDAFFQPLAGRMRFNQPYGSYLFANGDVLVMFATLGTARLDACGQVEWKIDANHHHSLTRAADGSFWISGREPEQEPDPLFPASSRPVIHDVLVHVSDSGAMLEKIKVFDVLRENEELLRRHLLFQPDDTHLNDVESLPPSLADEYPLFETGDLLVSLKHLNAILVADPETLKVKWWTGAPFIHQHDPDFVGNGWIGVFDNREDGTQRGTQLGGSRIVAFQPHTDSVRIWYEPTSQDPLYTANRGSWQLLANGNFLLTESNAGRVAELSGDGSLVWEWIQQPYGETKVPVVYWAERYDLTPERVASWPCSPDDSSAMGEESE